MTPEQAARLAAAYRAAAEVLDEVAGEGAPPPRGPAAPKPKRRRRVLPPPPDLPVSDVAMERARRLLKGS